MIPPIGTDLGDVFYIGSDNAPVILRTNRPTKEEQKEHKLWINVARIMVFSGPNAPIGSWEVAKKKDRTGIELRYQHYRIIQNLFTIPYSQKFQIESRQRFFPPVPQEHQKEGVIETLNPPVVTPISSTFGSSLNYEDLGRIGRASPAFAD